ERKDTMQCHALNDGYDVRVHKDTVLTTTFFFSNDPAPTEFYTLSLHDALPIWLRSRSALPWQRSQRSSRPRSERWLHCSSCATRSEEHTSELQSRGHLVCRLPLEKKKRPS